MVSNTKKLKAIVAVADNGLMAFNGDMPWHVSEDLRRFKCHTINQVIIYGKGTWESFDRIALPGRTNVLVSSSVDYDEVELDSVIIYRDLDTAITESQLNYSDKDIWIIGGASIYKQTLPIVDELYLTIIKDSEVNFNGELHDESQLLFLPDYPTVIDKLFTLSHEEETKYATYKKYIRKKSDFRNPTRPIFSKAYAESYKSDSTRPGTI